MILNQSDLQADPPAYSFKDWLKDVFCLAFILAGIVSMLFLLLLS